MNCVLMFFFVKQDPAHRDSEPDLVFEDMTVMSDFELHCLCREEQVSPKRICTSSGFLKNLKRYLPDKVIHKCATNDRLRDDPKSFESDVTNNATSTF